MTRNVTWCDPDEAPEQHATAEPTPRTRERRRRGGLTRIVLDDKIEYTDCVGMVVRTWRYEWASFDSWVGAPEMRPLPLESSRKANTFFLSALISLPGAIAAANILSSKGSGLFVGTLALSYIVMTLALWVALMKACAKTYAPTWSDKTTCPRCGEPHLDSIDRHKSQCLHCDLEIDDRYSATELFHMDDSDARTYYDD